MKTFQMILISTILSVYRQSCADGCLVCSPSNDCKLCDLKSHYINQSGTCQKITLTNCDWIDAKGNCLECESEFYVDSFTKKCVSLEVQNKISFCDAYKNPLECQKCAKKYYLKDGKCQKVEIEVPNCEVQNESHCFLCDKGMILHPKGERCLPAPSTSNCMNFGYLQCQECKKGYFYNSNIFVAHSPLNEKHSEIENYIQNLNLGVFSPKGLSPCQEIEIPNCVEFESFSKCKKCAPFHFLNEEKRCEQYPLSEIPGCENYSNYNICTKCIQGFILSSPMECKEVKKIENCLNYNPSASINICIECENDFYVMNNICQERLLNIENCDQLSLTQDQCQTCSSGYYPTSDNLKCLAEVSQCSMYQQSSNASTTHVCTTCSDTFYLENNKCLQGSIANCRVYASGSTCSICDNKFYLDGNTCLPHNDVVNCSSYPNTKDDKHTCQVCDNSYLRFIQVQGCQKIPTLIPQCSVYTNTTTCSSCIIGYQLISNECQVIPPAENCLSKTGSNCTQCLSGYILNGDNECELPYKFETKECASYNTSGSLNSFQCDYCKANKYPWTFSNENVQCVTEEEITNKLGITATPITKCVNYKQVGVTRICIKCEETYYPEEDGLSCVQTCANTLLRMKTKQGDVLVDDSKCITSATFTNCEIAVPVMKINSFDENDHFCVKCKSNFYPAEIATQYQNAKTSYQIDDGVMKDFGVYDLGFGCVAMPANPVYHTTNNSSPPPNCDVYKESAGKLLCRKCKFGYTGKVDSTDSNNLICDSKVQDCDISTVYSTLVQGDMINSIISNHTLFNCHKCLTRDRIPFLFGNFQTKDIQDFGILYGNDSMVNSPVKEGKWIQCLVPRPESFEMKKDYFESRFVKNCGFGMFDVNKSKDFRLFQDDSSLKCLMCKPGYRATYQEVVDGGNTDRFIVSCDQIKNCKKLGRLDQGQFNSCHQCEFGYAWRVSGPNNNLVINYDYCIKTRDANCLMQQVENAFTENERYSCFMCRNGFVQNKDGQCQKISAPYCEENQFHGRQFLIDTYGQGLIKGYQGFTRGCQKCSEGFVGMQWSTAKTVCINIHYKTPRQQIQSTHFVENCKYLKSSGGSVICQECLPGFVISSQGSNCEKQQIYPNCSIIRQDLEGCHYCESGYVNINKFCEKAKIKFCASYEDNQNYQKCQTCESSYRLVDNQCIVGEVNHCVSYNGMNCQSCKSGYMLINIQNSKQYCVSYVDNLNCSSMSIINNGELQCNSCNTGYVISLEEEILTKTLCHSINIIENCKTYHNSGTQLLSSYFCTECEDNYYMKNNVCYKRNNQTTNCKTFSSSFDFCIECNSGYYLTNEKKCEPFPTGIYGCRNYTNKTQCESCQPNMYLLNNKCIKINILNRIGFCEIYKDQTTCLKCQFNYFLKDNVCVKSMAQNCQTQVTINECLTCPENFGYFNNVENQTVDCVYISSQNCKIAETEYPFKCKKCQRLYYQEQGRCFPNEKFIPHCDLYYSRDTCQKCDSGFILTQDRRMCLSGEQFGMKVWETCESAVELKKPVCNTCEFGYQLYKGSCYQCKQQTLSNGCMYCSGVEEEICVICKSGYFMGNDGKCLSNGSNPPVPVDVVVENPVTPETPEQQEQTGTPATETTTTDDNNTTTDQSETLLVNDPSVLAY